MSVVSPDTPSLAPPRGMPALMSACVVVVVAMVAAINLALPKLSRSDLEPTSTGLLWIVDSYILVFGGLLILAGAIGDRFGRKGVLLTASLPPARAGLGSGLNSAAREIGAALGVAVVGTLLTSKFASDLPARLREHADSTSETLSAAEQLGSTAHAEAVTAFTDATGAGYLVIAGVVLIAAVSVVPGLREKAPKLDLEKSLAQ